MGWSNAGTACGTSTTCTITASSGTTTVTAQFGTTLNLTVAVQGASYGSVSSNPAGINCGATCSYNFNNATTTVTLTATPANGGNFAGWGGACSGTQLSCTVNISQAQSVTATFSNVSLSQALDNPNLTWTTSGNTPWFGETTVSEAGGSAAASGSIAANQQSAIQTTVTGPANISFYWQVSSQLNHDILQFSATGPNTNIQTSISGTVAWQQIQYSLPAGQFVLTWTYSKDSAMSSGSDTAWLDQVQVQATTVSNAMAKM